MDILCMRFKNYFLQKLNFLLTLKLGRYPKIEKDTKKLNTKASMKQTTTYIDDIFQVS